MFEQFLGFHHFFLGKLSTVPDSENVIFTYFLLHLTSNFSTKSSEMPHSYSVTLDVIGFGQKPNSWYGDTSYINTR